MGRGKTKGKKLHVTQHDETGNGEEEKIPVHKKRGRPQKALKDEMDEARKLKYEDSEDTSGKEMTSQDHVEKQKRDGQEKEGVVESPNNTTEEPNKSNGFRQIGNRRKNKPRRAAEAVVECH